MVYEFKDFGQTAEPSPLSIRTIIDGIELDYELTFGGFSFTTTSVSGRGRVTYRNDVDEVYGRAGGLHRKTTLSTRSIVVTAKVSARSNELYREGMSALLNLLESQEVHSIKFTDDMAYTFYGSTVSVNDEGEKSNKQVIEIEFLCSDPFKYSDEKITTVSNAETLSIDSEFPVVPEEIEITFGSAADAKSFSLNNTTTDMRIVYDHTGSASSTTVRIRQKDDYIGYTSSVNHLDALNIAQSHFDEFTVVSGDQLVVTPAPTRIKLKYRGVSL